MEKSKNAAAAVAAIIVRRFDCEKPCLQRHGAKSDEEK